MYFWLGSGKDCGLTLEGKQTVFSWLKVLTENNCKKSDLHHNHIVLFHWVNMAANEWLYERLILLLMG